MIPGLFLGFFRVGVFGFGGGPSMLSLMEAECVSAGWVSHEQFLEGLAVGNALPGPITTKMAMYVGWVTAGPLGAMAALVGLVLPSALLMLGLTALLLRYRDHPRVAGALEGARPAVVAMLFYVAVELSPSGVTGWQTALFAGCAFALLWFKVHPGLVMVGALALGAVLLSPR